MALPDGYSTDESVGFKMLVDSMNRHNLTPVGVQNHGQLIIDALNEDYPGLNVYLSETDAPVWPGFGSLDVTIDSGLGGWQFRPDGYVPYYHGPVVIPSPTTNLPPDISVRLQEIEKRLSILESTLEAAVKPSEVFITFPVKITLK